MPATRERRATAQAPAVPRATDSSAAGLRRSPRSDWHAEPRGDGLQDGDRRFGDLEQLVHRDGGGAPVAHRHREGAKLRSVSLVLRAELMDLCVAFRVYGHRAIVVEYRGRAVPEDFGPLLGKSAVAVREVEHSPKRA